MRLGFAALAGMLLPIAAAHGQSLDPRIQVAVYDPGQVYDLPVFQGFAAVVEFAPGENVESVVVGSSSLWQITTSAKGDRVVVKPLPGASPTDMIVVTDAHRYAFFLNSSGSAQDVYVLRFTYGGKDGVAPTVLPAASGYRLTGSRRIRPLRITDDGRSMTLTWSSQAPLPAIFAYGESGEESIVNGRMIAGRYVIEGVHSKLVFRLGRDQAIAERRTPRARR